MNLQNKRLLILGGNVETASLVQKARSLGVYTIVVDPNPDAPAKKLSNESYEVDGLDINSLYELSKNLELDGLLVGVADILVPSYQKLASMHNFPCYASDEITKPLCFKDEFSIACKKFGIKTIPTYKIDNEANIELLNDGEFPLMVKPIDNGAGVGMSIAWNKNDLIKSMQYALKNSAKGKFIIERYMTTDDMLAYYTFKDGKAYLSAVADRITTKKQGDASPVCIAAIYPSKYLSIFLKKIHPLLLNLFKGLNIQNGVLNIQFFVENGDFYAYDPGFRLQGEAPHIPINAINGFDSREMLINFALTGSMGVDDLEIRNDPNFRNKFTSTIWILLKAGKITKIDGLDKIKSDMSVIDIIQRFEEHDVITDSMVGNERQVFARIYILGNSLTELKNKIKWVNNTLKIYDLSGNNMIVDSLDNEIFDSY